MVIITWQVTHLFSLTLLLDEIILVSIKCDSASVLFSLFWEKLFPGCSDGLSVGTLIIGFLLSADVSVFIFKKQMHEKLKQLLCVGNIMVISMFVWNIGQQSSWY